VPVVTARNEPLPEVTRHPCQVIFGNAFGVTCDT